MPVPEPGGEAVIRVRLAGVCATDIEITQGYKGFQGVLGHEFVGVVIAASDEGWIGKRVCGEINVACGTCESCRGGLKTHCLKRSVLGILGRNGAFAELITLPVENLHLVPHSIADEEAVFVEPLAAAFEILEQVSFTGQEAVAVLGDGKLANLCAQVIHTVVPGVKIFGRHERKLDLLRELGIEATSSPPTGSFDVVVEATGSTSGLTTAMEVVKPRGTVVLKSTVAAAEAIDLSPIVVKELTVIGSRCGRFQRAIEALRHGLVQVKPLIEAVYPLEQGVAALEHAARRGSLKVLINPELET